MLINIILPFDRTILIYALTGWIPLYILIPRRQNHVKYLPHAQDALEVPVLELYRWKVLAALVHRLHN